MLNRPASTACLFGIVLTLGVAFLPACKHQDIADAQSPSEAKVVEVHGEGVVHVDHPEQFALAAVVDRPTVDELHATGVVAPDVNRSVPVLSLAGGRAADIRVKLGDVVRKGQVLLVIDSPDVAQAFSDYQKFQADQIFAQQQLTRARDLYDKGAVAHQDLEAAEDVSRKAQVDVATAKQRVSVLGADPGNPSPLVSIRAPISGSIVEQNVTGGTGVRSLDNSPNLFTIADLSTVWVLCDVYENDLYRVHLGDTGEVRLNAIPDRTFTGRVGNISTVLDPATRSAKVRLELSNPGGQMRAGMFATATFRSRTEQMRPTVPTTAVIRLHDKDWVFVPLGDEQFRQVEVETGTLGGNYQVIQSGVASGQKVVANALQFSTAAGME